MSGYKDTFKMINGDAVIENNDLVIVSAQEELRQNIENRLSVNKNEWFLNIALGLNYNAIQGKGKTDIEIEYAIRECCLQDDRVQEVRDITILRDAKNRTVSISMNIVDKDENQIYMQEVIDVG